MFFRKFIYASICFTLIVSASSFSAHQYDKKITENLKGNSSLISWIKDHKTFITTTGMAAAVVIVGGVAVANMDLSVLPDIQGVSTLCPEILEPCMNIGPYSVRMVQTLSDGCSHAFSLNKLSLVDVINERVLPYQDAMPVLQNIATMCRLGSEEYSLQLVGQNLCQCTYQLIKEGAQTSTTLGEIIFNVWGWCPLK